jgi:hypothetical protein
MCHDVLLRWQELLAEQTLFKLKEATFAVSG